MRPDHKACFHSFKYFPTSWKAQKLEFGPVYVKHSNWISFANQCPQLKICYTDVDIVE